MLYVTLVQSALPTSLMSAGRQGVITDKNARRIEPNDERRVFYGLMNAADFLYGFGSR